MTQRHELGFIADWGVSRETVDRFETLASLVTRWTTRINLIGPGTVPDLWTRHILDSAQLWPHCPPDAKHWVDLGSGAGFPGLVIAILAAAEQPDLTVTLVEADRRKATFLEMAIRELSLSTQLLTQRIEDIPPLNADVVSARAVAPLDTLLDHAERHRKPGGVSLFPKGRRGEQELTVARKKWQMSVTRIQSLTDPEAVIFKIGACHRA